MRVTDSLIFQLASRTTAQAREALEQAMEVASTGTRVAHPSDDPAAAGLGSALRISSEREAAILKASQAASDELGVVDSALGDVSTQLSRARVIAMQYASAGYDAQARSMGAQEVASIAGQIVGDVNSRFGNRYVFGGNRDGAPPFDASGGYSGDAGVRQVEIAPGVYEQANVRADVAFKGAGGGVDVFQVLSDLQTALEQNDPSAVSATLDGIDAALAQVASAQSQAGISMHTFGAAISANRIASANDSARAGSALDADVIQASIQLRAAETALQASLSAAAQSFKLTLLSYL